VEAFPAASGAPSHDKIFDRFYRADPARTRNSGGFGLGLAIAQWMVNARSAEINVTSSLNQGSTFIVRFPQFVADPPASSHTEPQESTPILAHT
jgi:signal transduction histidine kinase